MLNTSYTRPPEQLSASIRSDVLCAYSGEREHSFRLNVNTFSLNALPTEVCTPGVHVQSIS